VARWKRAEGVDVARRERWRFFIRDRRSQTVATLRGFGGEIGPAIGFQDGFIQLVVELP